MNYQSKLIWYGRIQRRWEVNLSLPDVEDLSVEPKKWASFYQNYRGSSSDFSRYSTSPEQRIEDFRFQDARYHSLLLILQFPVIHLVESSRFERYAWYRIYWGTKLRARRRKLVLAMGGVRKWGFWGDSRNHTPWMRSVPISGWEEWSEVWESSLRRRKELTSEMKPIWHCQITLIHSLSTIPQSIPHQFLLLHSSWNLFLISLVILLSREHTYRPWYYQLNSTDSYFEGTIGAHPREKVKLNCQVDISGEFPSSSQSVIPNCIGLSISTLHLIVW